MFWTIWSGFMPAQTGEMTLRLSLDLNRKFAPGSIQEAAVTPTRNFTKGLTLYLTQNLTRVRHVLVANHA